MANKIKWKKGTELSIKGIPETKQLLTCRSINKEKNSLSKGFCFVLFLTEAEHTYQMNSLILYLTIS